MPVKLVGWLLLSALSTACSALHPRGPTDVARGEYHSAGRPEYDSFFILLHEKQVELLSAPSEPLSARERLTHALALTPEASDEALTQRLRTELQKLASQGLRLRLEVPPPSTAPDASATLHVSETSTDTPLRVALPQEATRLVRARNHMLSTRAELEKMRVMGITLEGSVDRDFRTGGPWKRDEVRDNLTDGQKVITLLQARASETEAYASHLLGLLGAAAVTDETLGQPPAPPPAAEPAPPRRGPPRGRAVAPSNPGPASATKAPSKPNADDEAAPPRPAQGSAPAEIDP